jgi:type IV secretory pathway TraG/TraD family ATPase VirD4
MDLNVKEYMEAGRYAQLIFKLLWQQATERRVKSAILEERDRLRPVFIWADECQEFITSEDAAFQATARSARACTVYITQNLPNLYRILNNKHEVDAFLGNLATKIFHANADVATNEFAANTIGRDWIAHRSISYGNQQNSGSINRSESYDFLVPPIQFSRLKKGGVDNNGVVQSYFFQNGRTFGQSQNPQNELPYAKLSFQQ